MANFLFKTEELSQKLSESTSSTGHWELQFKKPQELTLYITIEQGRVLFSGTEKLCWRAFLKTLQSYLFCLHTSQAQKAIQKLEESVPEEPQIRKMLGKMEQMGLITREAALKSISLQILSDFDNYLFNTSGRAKFILEPELLYQAQIPGIRLEDLILRTKQRRLQWQEVQSVIISMKSIPKLHPEVLERANLTPQKKQQLEKLVASGKTLETIARDLVKDQLEIAQLFAKLINKGVVSMDPPPELGKKAEKTEVFIVDDSPVLLQQFEGVVTGWGYKVNTCVNALTALDQILNSKPTAIFIDINMPRLSGFDLIKQIRRQPELTLMPLVLLTAENSISNQWRAKWANCKFLAKPSTPEEIPKFLMELRLLLQEISPLPTKG